MPPDENIYVVAPRADREVDAGWLSTVASTPGVRVVAGFGRAAQVVADEAAATALRCLLDGALRVEPVKDRNP